MLVVFVCQAGTLESFMRVADTVVTGTSGLLTRPETTCHPGREAILFCDVEEVRSASPRAWRLPELPPARRGENGFEPREAELPLTAAG